MCHTGFAFGQTPHGYLYCGPGLVSIFPLSRSNDNKNNPELFFLESLPDMTECSIANRDEFIASKPALIGISNFALSF